MMKESCQVGTDKSAGKGLFRKYDWSLFISSYVRLVYNLFLEYVKIEL